MLNISIQSCPHFVSSSLLDGNYLFHFILLYFLVPIQTSWNPLKFNTQSENVTFPRKKSLFIKLSIIHFPVSRFSQNPKGGLTIAHHKKSAKSPIIFSSFSYKLADSLNTYKDKDFAACPEEQWMYGMGQGRNKSWLNYCKVKSFIIRNCSWNQTEFLWGWLLSDYDNL